MVEEVEDQPGSFGAAQYALRSTFFYRGHHFWQRLFNFIDERAFQGDWAKSADWGISPLAWKRVQDAGVNPFHVFAHPETITSDTRLIAYYRTIALLPQKGLIRLAFGTASLEANPGKLTEERASMLVSVINSLTSSLVETDPRWTLEGARIAAILNAGSQVNGSWRNAIGSEGARQVAGLMLGVFEGEELVESAELIGGIEVEAPVDASAVASLRELRLKNGARIRFSSEPDVAFRDSKGTLVGTAEIKYGSDPAGALERYGAARKSFEEAVKENARVQNLYLANAITAEVQRRINADRLVSGTFEIAALLTDTAAREEFFRFLRRRILDI